MVQISNNFPIKYIIVIYPSEEGDLGSFTAHCLNMDIIADDDTVEGAVGLLLELIETNLDSAREHNANAFRDAPKEYWDKLALAQKLSPELNERIIRDANRRLGHEYPIDLERNVDLRQFQTA